MASVPGSLVDDVLASWGEAVARREGVGGWAAAETARAALAVLEQDAEALRVLDPRLEDLAARFGLGDERRLLAVAVLGEAHPSAHLLTGLLSGDDGAARPTVALAWECVGLGTVDAWARTLLEEGGPLLSTGLLEVDGGDVLLARRVRVPDRLVAHLLGSPLVPQDVARVLVEPRPVDVVGHVEVAESLRAGEPLVWVCAPAGTAGASLAVAACREVGVTCLVGDLGRIPAERAADVGATGVPPLLPPSPTVVRRTVRALLLEAALEGSVLVLLEAQHAVDDLDLLRGAVVPVVAVGRTPWEVRSADALPTIVNAGRLSRAERETLWRQAVGSDATTDDVLAMRITPEEIELVGARARADADRAGRQVGGEDVRRAVRSLGTGHRSRPGGGAPATLEDLVLPDHTRGEVERLIGWARDRDDVLGLGELHGKGGKGTGICALFSGSPGTGKTLAAHVVADSLGADLFQVDLSTVVDKFIGETEKNLERVFARAESLNAVLFFDEADALFGSRSAVNDARDRYANQEVSFLLQRMEAFEGITVLATNLRGNLDPAFARRLHFMVHFPDPDTPTRRRLWEHHLAQLPGTDPADPVDLDLLCSSLELAGGDIRNIVLSAAYDAVAGRRLVGMTDLRRAVEREMAKLGRRVADRRWATAQT